jgi:hypothetical protein
VPRRPAARSATPSSPRVSVPIATSCCSSIVSPLEIPPSRAGLGSSEFIGPPGGRGSSHRAVAGPRRVSVGHRWSLQFEQRLAYSSDDHVMIWRSAVHPQPIADCRS